MFRERVIEGQRKQGEWRKIMKRLAAENPDLSNAQAATRARKELGYEGAARERVHYHNWLKKKAGNETRLEGKRREAKVTWEFALSQLPDKSDPVKDIKWIQNHPAMSRKSRQKNEATVLLTAEDILSPPHGQAPSRYAATSLQTWVNRPDDFFKIVLNEQKKASKEDDTIKDKAAELSIKEMEDMLASMAPDNDGLLQSSPEG